MKIAMMVSIKTGLFEFHKPLFTKYYRARYKKTDITLRYQTGRDISRGLSHFKYFDQSWNDIRYIDRIFFAKSLRLPYFRTQNTSDNNKIDITSERSAEIRGGKSANNWVLWKSPDLTTDRYVIGFDATIKSFLTEFQIAFMYKGIADRLRFLVIENKTLSFEIVRNGFFHDKLISVPFSFEAGRKYRVELVVNRDVYSFCVDGSPILSVQDSGYRYRVGGIALIFWDRDGKDEMAVDIEDFSLKGLT